MTKKEELLNLDDEDLYKYIEKFCHERYFKLNTTPHYFKKGDMGQPYIQNDVVNIPYYEACKGSGDYDSFDIPIDYLFMTDEEILEDMALEKTKKYYLISYSYNDEDYGLCHTMKATDDNALDWIFGMVKFDKSRGRGESKRYTNFVLLNYWEITKEQYEKWREL